MPHADGRPTKAERKAAEEKAKRDAAALAAKRGPKVAPKMGKFVADRGKADESLRVVALFKEFTDRGKVPVALLPQLVKELFKGAGDPPFVAKLSRQAKETLTAKAAATDNKLAAGDFTSWYFEVAWPAITEAKQEAKAAKAAAEAQKAAEAKAAAEELEAQRRREAEEAEQAAKLEEAARKAEEAALEEERRKREEEEERRREEMASKAASDVATQQSLGQQPGADPRGEARLSSTPRSEPDASNVHLIVEHDEYDDSSPAEPTGWGVASSVDLAESRRVIAIFANLSMSWGDPRMRDVAEGEVIVPAKAVRGALVQALAPIEDDDLLATAPRASGPGVAIGELVRFWFDSVWPKHGEALRGDNSPDPGEEARDAQAPPGTSAVDVE
jgi:chemotaxis protein histidine kinase CheA